MVGGLEHVWADRDPVDAADTTLTSYLYLQSGISESRS